MVDGIGIRDRGPHITNNHNSNIIRIKESGGKQGERGRMRQEKGVIFGSILR